MNEPLPSLTALKVFATCARNMSFARAADELGITPAAVTQHIRTLEKWVGAPLFRRTGRSVHLTSEAQAALPLLTEGFNQISQAADMLRASEDRDRVVLVSTPPAFAGKWLLGRLDRFRDAHPEFDVWVSVDPQIARPDKATPDVFIQYGLRPADDLISEVLMHDEVVPVASPDFISRFGPLDIPAQLTSAPLLHYVSNKVDDSFPDWPAWFSAHGIRGISPGRGARFDHPGLLIDQAAAGQGAALAKRLLTIPQIKDGQLVQLFGESTPVRTSYWMSRPRGKTLKRSAQVFLTWLREDVHTALSN